MTALGQPLSAADLLGSAGAMAIILAYALLQTGRWQSRQIRYSVTNALGSAAILVSLIAAPNLPSILIEGFWLLISLYGVLKGMQKTLHQR